METFINDFRSDISEISTFSQNETEWRADIQQIPLWIKIRSIICDGHLTSYTKKKIIGDPGTNIKNLISKFCN